ncbi:hypothetical protein G6F32_016323 [Rhizopus arrhizus]|nr:hypothetical protein G6F32_016323 [Rhizopus arrhizus]
MPLPQHQHTADHRAAPRRRSGRGARHAGRRAGGGSGQRRAGRHHHAAGAQSHRLQPERQTGTRTVAFAGQASGRHGDRGRPLRPAVQRALPFADSRQRLPLGVDPFLQQGAGS